MKKTINYKKIKCKTYNDYNNLYLEIEERSSKLPMVRIPDWARRRVNKQLKNGKDSIQEMREERRNIKLKRSGIKLSKDDSDLYKGLEKMHIDSLREIANSSTVKKMDIRKSGIPVKLMNQQDLLDYLKCHIGIRTINLTEKHRNNILRRINSKIIENHLIKSASRAPENNRSRNRKRNISQQQRRQNKAYSESFSRSQVISEILSEMLDDDDYEHMGELDLASRNNSNRIDNVKIEVIQSDNEWSNSDLGDRPEGQIENKIHIEEEMTWEIPPPYNELSNQDLKTISIPQIDIEDLRKEIYAEALKNCAKYQSSKNNNISETPKTIKKTITESEKNSLIPK